MFDTRNENARNAFAVEAPQDKLCNPLTGFILHHTEKKKSDQAVITLRFYFRLSMCNTCHSVSKPIESTF